MEVTRAALAAARPGVAVQLRDKRASARALVEIGRALREVTAAAGARLLVNGRPDVARAIAADGVHLPADALDVRDARRVLGLQAIVGRSCHDGDSLARAGSEGADYATLSPVHRVPDKGPPLGPGRLSALACRSPIPVLALGGIDGRTVAEAARCGVHGVAVRRAVYHSDRPAQVVARLLDALDSLGDAGG